MSHDNTMTGARVTKIFDIHDVCYFPNITMPSTNKKDTNYMTNVSSVMAVSCMMNGLVLHRWSTRQFFKGSVWETVTSDRRSIEYTLKYLVKCFFFHSFQSDQLAAFQFCTRAFFPFCFFYIIQSSSVYLFVCLFHEVSVVVFIVFFCLASSIL